MKYIKHLRALQRVERRILQDDQEKHRLEIIMRKFEDDFADELAKDIPREKAMFERIIRKHAGIIELIKKDMQLHNKTEIRIILAQHEMLSLLRPSLPEFIQKANQGKDISRFYIQSIAGETQYEKFKSLTEQYFCNSQIEYRKLSFVGLKDKILAHLDELKLVYQFNTREYIAVSESKESSFAAEIAQKIYRRT